MTTQISIAVINPRLASPRSALHRGGFRAPPLRPTSPPVEVAAAHMSDDDAAKALRGAPTPPGSIGSPRRRRRGHREQRLHKRCR